MNTAKLEYIFKDLVSEYSTDQYLINKSWNTLETMYSNENRYYHTLAHLCHFYESYLLVKDKIEDKNSFLLAMFYHDIIYDLSEHDNEYKSSQLARQELEVLNIPNEIILKTQDLILATKSHESSVEDDCKYFLDCDLSILGSNQENYITYYKSIRKEYSNLPDQTYNMGRSKVLHSFLNRKKIFSTAFFEQNIEQSARVNLRAELNILDSKEKHTL